MRDIDAELLQLREIEVRVEVFERRLGDLDGVIQRLSARGLDHEWLALLRETLLESLALLDYRRIMLLRDLQPTESPAEAGRSTPESDSSANSSGS